MGQTLMLAPLCKGCEGRCLPTTWPESASLQLSLPVPWGLQRPPDWMLNKLCCNPVSGAADNRTHSMCQDPRAAVLGMPGAEAQAATDHCLCISCQQHS